MLGTLLARLTDQSSAEALLAEIADPAMLGRVRSAAAADRMSPGVYVAATLRHMIDHGGEELWLDLVGRMANSPQPGAAALNALLARAFAPAPG